MRSLLVLYVFALGFFLDYFYVLWVRKVGEGKRYQAAAASVAIAIPSVLGITEIVYDRWLMLPYFAGLFLGTLCSTKEE